MEKKENSNIYTALQQQEQDCLQHAQTTKLSLKDTALCHITQLSAVYKENEFNVYTVPRRPITPDAGRLTGFSVHHGQLYLHGRLVGTVSLFSALTSFIDFLSNFHGPVLLAAHNAKKFDALVLTRLLQKRFSLWQRFNQVVSGFVDTLTLSRNLYPRLGIKYSLKSLVKFFLDKPYNAHDGLEDARMLQELFNFCDPSSSDIKLVTLTTEEF